MYADKYGQRKKLDPGSAGLSLALIGVIGTGLALSSPTFKHVVETTMDGYNVPLVPPPPPIEIKPEPKARITKITPAPGPVIPDKIVDVTPTDHFIDPGPSVEPGTSGGNGTVIPTIKPPPVIIGPQPDTRFAGIFQPEYPAGERRAEHQGRVVVRVLIGVDGRVKQIEKVSAASDAFFAATQKRALEKWRFKPGTQDGIPVEAWRTMTVSFVLSQESGQD